MIINTNMNALNAHRNMGMNNTAAGKSMEKLSSGLRINRAGDDAAGLAISEKMRGQIRGLDQASKNSQDGISLIQTAEGALNETHNILQRMRELAVQSSNDTNNADDRAEIQKEVSELSKEVSRIANNTQFNEQNLLDGSYEGKFHIGANQGQDITLSVGNMDASSLGTIGVDAGKVEAGGLTITNSTGQAVTVTVVAATAGSVAGVTQNTTTGAISVQLGAGSSSKDAAKAINEAGIKGIEAFGSNVAADAAAAGPLAAGTENANTGLNVSSQKSASEAITTLNDAIKSVSAQRSNLGAVQNRLEHTTANLENTSENLTAAESRIRDVDMAKEMLNFSKNNILNQAAQSMLAQAKSQPEGVLQLLR